MDLVWKIVDEAPFPPTQDELSMEEPFVVKLPQKLSW